MRSNLMAPVIMPAAALLRDEFVVQAVVDAIQQAVTVIKATADESVCRRFRASSLEVT